MNRLASGLAIALALAVAAGCGAGEDYNVLSSFRPPPGVSATTSPESVSLRMKHIGVLNFRNESGVPNAGKQLAGIFYESLSQSPRYDVQPPPPAEDDGDLEYQFRLERTRRGGVRNEESDSRWIKEKIQNFVSSVRPYVTNLDLIYPGEYFEGTSEPAKKPAKETLTQSSAAVSDEPDLDAYLTGVVTSFRNRSGNAILGEKGSHVTYTVYLVSAKDGSIIWKATFDEEQIYLLDNLLLLPRYAKAGFIWQTNETLARNGLERVLATFPGLREKIEKPPAEKP